MNFTISSKLLINHFMGSTTFIYFLLLRGGMLQILPKHYFVIFDLSAEEKLRKLRVLNVPGCSSMEYNGFHLKWLY